MKILLCKVGKRKILYQINIFDRLVKFWTLLYSSKTVVEFSKGQSYRI